MHPDFDITFSTHCENRISPRILQTEILITASKEKGKWYRERKDPIGKTTNILVFWDIKKPIVAIQILMAFSFLTRSAEINILYHFYPS